MKPVVMVRRSEKFLIFSALFSASLSVYLFFGSAEREAALFILMWVAATLGIANFFKSRSRRWA